jgi:hypothetical protein
MEDEAYEFILKINGLEKEVRDWGVYTFLRNEV